MIINQWDQLKNMITSAIEDNFNYILYLYFLFLFSLGIVTNSCKLTVIFTLKSGVHTNFILH